MPIRRIGAWQSILRNKAEKSEQSYAKKANSRLLVVHTKCILIDARSSLAYKRRA